MKKAYQYRKNSNPGEYVPNPKTDLSFKRFSDNKTFAAVMEQIHADTAGYAKEQVEGGLATCAILTKLNEYNFQAMGGVFPNAENEKTARKLLAKWRDIHSKKDVYQAISELKGKGHRKRFKDSIAFLKNKAPKEFEMLLEKERIISILSNR